MSPQFLRALRGLACLTLATGCAVTVAPPAHAAPAQASAICDFPLIGAQPVTFEVSLPSGLRAGDSAPPNRVTNLRFPDAVLGLADRVEFVYPSYIGTMVKGPVFAPTGTVALLNGALPLPDEIFGGMYTFQRGDYTSTVDQMVLNIRPTDARGRPVALPKPATDSDSDAGTYDVLCTIDGAPTATMVVAPAVDDTPPTPPTSVTVSGVTPTIATVNWAASSDDSGVDRYKVDLVGPVGSGAIPSVQVSDLQAPFTGLRPDTAYTVTVRAIDTEGNVSESGTTTFRTPKVTAPKISNYSVTGGFTIWVEPQTAPGEPRLACTGAVPSMTLDASGFDTVVGGTKLYFQGLWQTKYGYPIPFPGGLLRSSDDGITYLRDGAIEVNPAYALGFVGGRGSMLVADRTALPSSGRVTVLGWYPVRVKWFGFSLVVPTFLPTKSVPFGFVDKPAGACTSGGDAFYLKA